MALKELVDGYSSKSTAHGVSYIMEKDAKPIGRFFWALVVMASLVVAAVITIVKYNEWKDNPVLTTLQVML